MVLWLPTTEVPFQACDTRACRSAAPGAGANIVSCQAAGARAGAETRGRLSEERPLCVMNPPNGAASPPVRKWLEADWCDNVLSTKMSGSFVGRPGWLSRRKILRMRSDSAQPRGTTMAKYRHRVFEMYEQREEAIRALTPRSGKPATDANAPDLGTFAHLEVARAAGMILVQFKEPQTFEDGTASDLREDLTRMADLLGKDSKVLFDFSGVAAFNAASISALVQFNRTLQTRGSRIALCCLEPPTRESFFATG